MGSISVRTSALTQLREVNRATVVRLLSDKGPLTQSQLASLSGLSKATVSNLVKELVDKGLVSSEYTVHNGRRAKLVKLNPTQRVALGVDISEQHFTLALVSIDRTVLGNKRVPVSARWGGRSFQATVKRNVADLLSECGRKDSDLVALGVGLPAPVQAQTQKVALLSVLPTWMDEDALAGLHTLTEGCVTLCNDANAAALAEVTFGIHRGTQNLIYIMISRGIGAGMYLRGDQFFGDLGFAGEIGHVQSSSGYELCRCGNRGCLEGEVAVPTLIKQVQAAGVACDDIEDVARALDSGHIAARRVVADAGAILGRTLADLSSLLNPQVMVIGGNPAVGSEVFLDSARRALRRHCLPLLAEHIDVYPDSLAGRAVALGAAESALRQMSL